MFYRKRTRHKLENRWEKGVFVGVKIRTTEKIVADSKGTYVVQSIRRVPLEQRFNPDLLKGIRGTPWELSPGDASTELPEPLPILPQLPDVPAQPARAFDTLAREACTFAKPS